jgi:hypothetical protein
METTGQLSADEKSSQQYGKWMRLAIWYQRTPVLREINPFAFPGIILAILLMIITIALDFGCSPKDFMPDEAIKED